jgi:hypothetical protein
MPGYTEKPPRGCVRAIGGPPIYWKSARHHDIADANANDLDGLKVGRRSIAVPPRVVAIL